jgi:hypothetical protein
MAVLRDCFSNKTLTSISLTRGHMSANGLGKLLESHSQTLQDLQLRYITFGDGDNFMAMFAQICAFTNLDSLDMIGLRQGGVKLKVDRAADSAHKEEPLFRICGVVTRPVIMCSVREKVP